MKTALLVLAAAGMVAAAGFKPLPDLVLKDSSGKTVSLKKFRGKVVLVDFWATWCHGCKEEIPWFAEFQKNYGKKGLTVVGVSMDDGWDVVKTFLAANPLPYRIVLGNDGVANRFGITNLPNTYLIDRQGNVAAAWEGMVDKDQVDAEIRKALQR